MEQAMTFIRYYIAYSYYIYNPTGRLYLWILLQRLEEKYRVHSIIEQRRKLTSF